VKFLADEGVDRPIVERLRQSGHQVWYVAELEPGISDDVVLDLANREGAILLTSDRDFGELVFRQGRLTTGVVLIRLSGISPGRKAEIVDTALAAHGDEMAQAFTVITPAAVRIRRRPVRSGKDDLTNPASAGAAADG
jgi:predicted nuclease of predicted toxin-antitoxin system